jgi:hypothetical protein
MAEEYKKYQDRDYSKDQISPKFIHEQVRAHDKMMIQTVLAIQSKPSWL